MDKKVTLIDIFNTVYKRRKQIIIATLTVSFLTAIIMLLVPNYYKATTVFYSASPDLAKPDPDNSNMIKRYYGNKEDIDRLLTIANSNNVKDFLISKYHLYKHYGIDSTSEKAKYKIRKKLDKFLNTVKNDRDAIELSMEDKDKVLAATMANDTRDFVERQLRKMVENIQITEINKYKNSIKYKNAELKKLMDSIEFVKNKYSIYDPGTQGESLTEQLTTTKSKLSFLKSKYNIIKKNRYVPRDSIALLQANISGFEAKLKKLDSLIQLYNKGFSILKPLLVQKDQLTYRLTADKNKLEKLEILKNSGFKVIHLVEKAEVPVHKYRPKRSLYVLGAFFLTLFFSILIVLAMEEIKKIKSANKN